MAHKTYEFKMVFTVDDTNEEAMEVLQDLKLGIASGKIQREMMQDAKLITAKIILTEVK